MFYLHYNLSPKYNLFIINMTYLCKYKNFYNSVNSLKTILLVNVIPRYFTNLSN